MKATTINHLLDALILSILIFIMVCFALKGLGS